MKKTPARSVATTAVIAMALIGMTACSASGDSADPKDSSGASSSVVIDASFIVKTIDPARAFEDTASLVDRALYQTLLTFEGGDVTTPVNGLASYEFSDEDKVMSLTMLGGAKFSDGTPLTVDDVVFSLERFQGIEGNPSFLLEGVKIEKTSDTTLTLTSPKPNPTLAYILPNPSLGIVNSKVVKENGGTTDKDDGAESFLNGTSAGSGPYVLESYDATSQIVLTANENYVGDQPAKTRIVLRNVNGETQSLNIQAGESQIALDLNPDQVAKLDASAVDVQTQPSTSTVYLMLNQSPAVDKWTSNPDFANAVKYGLDYDKLLALAGQGAVRPGGVVPSIFVGALPTEKGNQYDLDKAKASLAASGYNGDPIILHYASDHTFNGLVLDPFVQTIQSQLKVLGINIQLSPAPQATLLADFRSGKHEMGIAAWGNDYPDPSDYVVFLPGENLGARAMWEKGSAPKIEALGKTAATASGEEARDKAYQDLQVALNEEGPFIPLFQPVNNVVTAKGLTLTLNPVWTADLDSIK